MTQEEALQELIRRGIIKTKEDLTARINYEEHPEHSGNLRIHVYARFLNREVVALMTTAEPSLTYAEDVHGQTVAEIALHRGERGVDITLDQIHANHEAIKAGLISPEHDIVMHYNRYTSLALTAAKYGHIAVIDKIAETHKEAFYAVDLHGNNALGATQTRNHLKTAQRIYSYFTTLEEREKILSYANVRLDGFEQNDTQKFLSEAKRELSMEKSTQRTK